MPYGSVALIPREEGMAVVVLGPSGAHDEKMGECLSGWLGASLDLGFGLGNLIGFHETGFDALLSWGLHKRVE